MVAKSSALGASGEALAALSALPRFDPLAPRTEDRDLRRILLVSVAVHAVLLLLLWEAIFGAVIEQDDTVTVKMIEEMQKPKPKILQQRKLDTSVKQFKEILQREVVQIRPELRDQFQKTEVDPLENIEAPKLLENRRVTTERVSVFADLPTRVQPIQVDTSTPKVRKIHTARASSGPRKVQAAGPQINPQAVKVEAPTLATGVVSQESVRGSVTGARIRSIDSGVSDRLLQGDGGRGSLSGIERDCMKDPVCIAYLQLIRNRVYERWTIPPDTDAGRVVLSFRIDRGGSAHGIKLKKADDSTLGSSCEVAFRHASPFPPPPKEIHYLVNKGIRATFTYGN